MRDTDEIRADAVARAADGEARLPQEVLRKERVLERECGDCRLCCKILRFDQDDVVVTERGRWCSQAFEGGCRIHSTAPPVCAGMLCAWRAGFLGDAERPDKLRAVPVLEDRKPVGLTMIWHTLNEPELTPTARRAAQRMLGKGDPVIAAPVPQAISRTGTRMDVLVLPGFKMKGARGLPTHGMILKYNGAELIRLAAIKALGEQNVEHDVPREDPAGEG